MYRVEENPGRLLICDTTGCTDVISGHLRVGFVDFMTKHCSTWSTNERTLQSPLSTVCGQYCVAFLMFRCRDASMNAFTRLFTTDLVANDCRVFDWVAAVNKK